MSANVSKNGLQVLSERYVQPGVVTLLVELLRALQNGSLLAHPVVSPKKSPPIPITFHVFTCFMVYHNRIFQY